MKKHLFSFLLWFLAFNTHAQQTHILPDKATTDIVKIALDHTYNFEFEESKKLCEEIRRRYPNHPGPDFMMGLNIYWEMCFNDTYLELSPSFIGYMDRSIALSKKMLDKEEKDIEAVFFKLASECYLTLYFSERGEMGSTISYAKKMYGSMKYAFQLKSKLSEYYFPTGIYNYYAVKYPENHPSVKPFMFLFMSGDKAQGFKDLDYAWRNTVFCKMECAYHLCNIYLKYEGTPLLAFEYSKALHEKYPKNLFFTVRYIEVLLAQGNFKEAERLAHALHKSGKKYFIGIAYLFYGIIYEQYLKDGNTALSLYAKSIQVLKETKNPEVDYLSMAYAGVARHYKAIGNKAKATEYYKKCQEIAEYTTVMEEAKKYLSGK